MVLVAPTCASSDRAAEILSELDYLAAKPFVVSDRKPGLPALHLPLTPGPTEEFSPRWPHCR